MFTKNDLISDILAFGVRKDELLTFHTSMKAVGEIETQGSTSADVLIDAFRECIPDGILMIPTHTFRNIREDGPVFDIRRTMPCIGALPGAAVLRANRAVDSGDPTCIRSLHVSHSIVAIGKNARNFAEADRYSKTRTPMTGSYGKLYNQNGKILLIGVDLSRCTFIHAVDEYLDPAISGTVMIRVTDYDGIAFDKEVFVTNGPVSACFPRYQESLDKAGAVIYGKIGNAPSMLIDAKKCFEVVVEKRHELGIV